MSGFKYVEDPILGKGRAEFNVGGGTGGTSYVAGDGIAINGNTISATGGGGDVTEAEFKNLSDGTQSVSKGAKESTFVQGTFNWSDTPSQNALKLVHFSDIHADTDALARIVAEINAIDVSPDVTICTGDMVAVTGEAIASWWPENIFTCIGNHESLGSPRSQGGDWNDISMAQRSAWYIEPFETAWGITHTEGTSYYYKDFSAQKVRLIVLDSMLYYKAGADATAQTAWLSTLLASAITSNLHVLIACHCPPLGAIQRDCSFSRYSPIPQAKLSTISELGTMGMPSAVINAVASAISSGMKFIGYIGGHIHTDYVWDVTGDGSQFMYGITCSCITPDTAWLNYSDQFRDDTLDAFNFISIDTTNSILKIMRGGGANMDGKMRPRVSMAVNYATGEIIDREADRMYTPLYDISASTVTLIPGYNYSATVNSSLTLDAKVQSGMLGAESVLSVNLVGGSISTTGNVVLGDTFTQNAVNICSVKYVGEIAVVNVLTAIADPPVSGYVVSVTSGTASGSLYYGLSGSTETDIYFQRSLDNQICLLESAAPTATKHVIGNGASTYVTGSISPSASVTFSNLSMVNVDVTGGSQTYLDNVIVPNGSTVTSEFSSAGAKFYVLSGSTVSGAGVLKFNPNIYIPRDDEVTISGLTIIGDYRPIPNANGGTVILGDRAVLHLVDCIITGGTTYNGGGISLNGSGSRLFLTRCTITGNTASHEGKAIYCQYGQLMTLIDCCVGGNAGDVTGISSISPVTISGGTIHEDVRVSGAAGSAILSGTVHIWGVTAASPASISISADSVIDVTGTPNSTVMSGKIVVAAGGCTLITGATYGVPEATVSVAAGTYSAFNSDGTTVPPQS